MISPAKRYAKADDLAIVTSFFNPMKFRSREHVFRLFADSFRDSGLHLFRAIGVLGESESTMYEDPYTFVFNGGDVMWQQERLVNLAIARLPRQFTKVAWIDGDILFENANWAAETSSLLEEYPVVQPHYHSFRLQPGQTSYIGNGQRLISFAAIHDAHPQFSRTGNQRVHGHTGYAWAARRDLLEVVGLYDVAVGGTADHLMAHAFSGDFSSRCLHQVFLNGRGFGDHFRHWAESAWQLVHGHIGHVNGAALHMWHGEEKYRSYDAQNLMLSLLGFDPATDLCPADSGLWKWSSEGDRFRRSLDRSFSARLEDTVDAFENDQHP